MVSGIFFRRLGTPLFLKRTLPRRFAEDGRRWGWLIERGNGCDMKIGFGMTHHPLGGETSRPPKSSEGQQLILPFGWPDGDAPAPNKIPRADRVFVNRDLHMSGVDWIGFDMDYTLAIYRQERMDALSVELTVDRLIKRGYPTTLKDLVYDTRFPIRGLLVDRKHGHVLKMDRYKWCTVLSLHPAPPLRTRGALSRQAHPPAHHRYHGSIAVRAERVTSSAAVVNALDQRGIPDRKSLFTCAFVSTAHATHRVPRRHRSLARIRGAETELARTLQRWFSRQKAFSSDDRPALHLLVMTSCSSGHAGVPELRHFFRSDLLRP